MKTVTDTTMRSMEDDYKTAPGLSIGTMTFENQMPRSRLVSYPKVSFTSMEGMSVKVQGGVRLMQDCRSVRAQRPRRLMTVQFTRQTHSPALNVIVPSLNSTRVAASATVIEVQWIWYDETLVLPHERASSGHAEDGRGCAVTYHGADCYSNQDVCTDGANCSKIFV